MKHAILSCCFTLTATLTAGPALAAPPQQAAGGSILDKAINTPSANWIVYGPNQTSKGVPAKEVAGEHALRVTVTKKGIDPWDVGATLPIEKAVRKGDVMLLAVYLRAPDLAAGEKALVSNIGVQIKTAPYTPTFQGPAHVTNAWSIYYVQGRAASDFAPGTQQITVQLADDKRVMELGPAFVLDFGPDADPAKLPHSD